MSTNESINDYRRVPLAHAARGLITKSRTERAVCEASSPDRQFFLGVEAAAMEVLHPEMSAVRTDAWRARQRPEFLEGYLRTSTLIAAAAVAPEALVALPVPQPKAM